MSMLDLVLETCKYIYKNPGKSMRKYIFDMSQRSIWSYSYEVSEEIVKSLISQGVLNEVAIKEYISLEINIEKYVDYYNVNLTSDELQVLNYLLNNPKKSRNTYIRNLKPIVGDNVLDIISGLEERFIIRYCSIAWNDFKYSSVYIDFYSLKRQLEY